MTSAAAGTVLASAIALTVIAPIAAVAIKSRARLAIVLAAALLASLGVAIAVAGTHAWQPIVTAHLTIAVQMIAFAAIARLARSLFADPLDAVACALLVTLAASFGVLAAGPMSGELPTPWLNAALVLNPLVGAASAASIDLFRLPLLYDLSPIAHVRFDYPSWPFSALTFGSLALVGAAGTFITAVRKQ